MRLIIVSLALILVVCSSAFSLLDKALDTQWSSYKTLHGKSYGIKEIERRLIWQNNTNFIAQHNAEAKSGIHTFAVAMNQFGDLTGKEFGKMYTGYKSTKVAATVPLPTITPK